MARPAENLAVCKFGGGSGYTIGRITALDSRVTLTDDSRRNILLHNAFTVTGDPPFSDRGYVGRSRPEQVIKLFSSDPPFSDRGDVGAPVLALETGELVGVVVGYNDSGAICLPIQPILNALNVALVTEPVLFFREQTPSHDLSATNDLIFGRDRLGFSHYVSAFVSLISDKNTRPPLTVGIYGAWGTGKSFLMHKIACALKPQDCPDEMDEPPTAAALSLAAKTVLVKFEAWDYNGSDKLWAGLVERIFSALEQELGWYWQLKFNFWRNLKRQWQQARQKFLPYALISLALALVVVWLLLEPANRAAIATGGVITFLLLFVPQLVKLFSTSASQRVIDMFAAQDYKADIGFMGRIKADLRDFADNLPPTTKVIVFIDDLDRCDPKKAVEVLEAVKLLLELKQFIVFLALDARIITQAVEEYYGKVLTEAEITGYEYLDKIVQIPFSIPEPRPGELRNYLGSLMGLSEAQVTALEPEIVPPAPEFVARRVTTPPPVVSASASSDSPPAAASPPPTGAGQPVSDTGQPSPRPAPPAGQTESPAKPVTPTPRPFDTIEVPFTPDEQKAFLRLYPHLDPNPRRLKRLVNIYRLVRMLLRSQSDGQVVDFVNTPVGQSHVLAWLVLCEQWPYASHMMLEEIDQQFKAAQTEADARLALEQKTISSIYPVAQQRLAADNNEALQKLDLKYDRLEAFLNQHLANFALADLRRLRPFTINFNPALSAEVRLTLAHH